MGMFIGKIMRKLRCFRSLQAYIAGVVDGYGNPMIEYGWMDGAKGSAIMKKRCESLRLC